MFSQFKKNLHYDQVDQRDRVASYYVDQTGTVIIFVEINGEHIVAGFRDWFCENAVSFQTRRQEAWNFFANLCQSEWNTSWGEIANNKELVPC